MQFFILSHVLQRFNKPNLLTKAIDTKSEQVWFQVKLSMKIYSIKQPSSRLVGAIRARRVSEVWDEEGREMNFTGRGSYDQIIHTHIA